MGRQAKFTLSSLLVMSREGRGIIMLNMLPLYGLCGRESQGSQRYQKSAGLLQSVLISSIESTALHVSLAQPLCIHPRIPLLLTLAIFPQAPGMNLRIRLSTPAHPHT